MTLSRLLLAALPLLTACPPTSPPPGGGGGDGVGVGGDGGGGGGGATESPKLDGRIFLSTTVTDGGKPRTLVGTEHLTLNFGDGSRVGASAGCNSLGGSYSIADGALVVTDGAQTEIGCDTERHAQDEWYFGFLQSRPKLTLDGNDLVLAGGTVRIEYTDQKVVTPDLELAGPTWTVDTIVTGEAAEHAAWPSPATLTFATDGKVQVSTGCNTGSGSYAVKGDRITFSSVGITKKGCMDPLAQQLEAAVMGIVGGTQPVSFKISVSRLSLRNDSGAGIDLVGSKG